MARSEVRTAMRLEIGRENKWRMPMPSPAGGKNYGTVSVDRHRRHAARQLHGARREVHSRQGLRADDTRVQDFTHAADYARDRADHGRGHCDELRPPGWHCRRAPHGSRWALARAWHDHVPDFRELMAPA